MKKTFILICFLLAGIFSMAQKKTSSAPAAAPKTMNNVSATSFESTIAAGTLSLIKTFRQGDGKDFVAIYSLAKSNDASFNNRKPIQISLSRQSFDSVFTKTSSDLNAKWGVLNKYIESNKLLLTEERTWINLVNYFNGL